jgi:large subunit ribosomal protein LP2
MIEIAAFLLCKLGGKSGSAADIKAVLEAAGAAEISEDAISTLISDVDGKDLNAILAEGMEKLKDVPMGGGGGGGGGGAGGDGAGAAAVAEKEEEKEEEEEEMDMAGGEYLEACDVDSFHDRVYTMKNCVLNYSSLIHVFIQLHRY